MGITAFECLLNRLRGDLEPVRLYDFPAQLITRGSTRRQT
jgi:LacI family kdg operon repressor